MSVLTTTPLTATPNGASGVTVPTAGTMPTWGAWVEVIAATAAPIAIAGVYHSGGSYTGGDGELDIGIGTAGAEASVGTLRMHGHSSGGQGGPTNTLLPVPLGGIGAGVRVAVRGRKAGTFGFGTVSLLYYENFSSDQVTTISQVLSCAPSGSVSPTITPSATPWANSAWVELLASASVDSGLLGLVHGVLATGAEAGVEYDLGVGALGAETVITTLREAPAFGRLPFTWLPGLYPVASGSRIAVRMRKAGTPTTAHPVALLYYTNVSALVAVPDVVGMTEAAADAALVAVGLVTGTVTTASDPVIPAGEIISQSPTAGTLVAPGSAVAIVVSTGPALVTVPNVVGMTQAAAIAAIGAADLGLGTITTASDPTVPAGQVISQTPTAGSSVLPGTTVDLVISTGPHDYTWQIEDMPDVTRWMTGLLLFPVGETPTPGVVTPGQVVIPMHVTTRVVFHGHLDGVPDECCCH